MVSDLRSFAFDDTSAAFGVDEQGAGGRLPLEAASIY